MSSNAINEFLRANVWTNETPRFVWQTIKFFSI